MALSLDAIYQPFNAFFVQKFAADDAPVKFRFARVPRTFADSDFVSPVQPQAGPSATVAAELFSMVVDRTMLPDVDGQTVWQSPSKISDAYDVEILGGSNPFVPDDVTDPNERQDDFDSVVTAKAEALRLQQNKLESVLNPSFSYHPSSAEPANWWDRTDAGVWTQWSFDVEGAVSAPPPGTAPSPETPRPPNLLRMKLSDAALSSVILNLDKPEPPPEGTPAYRLAPESIARFRAFTPAAAAAAPAAVPLIEAVRVASMAESVRAAPMMRRPFFGAAASRIGGSVIEVQPPPPPPPLAPPAGNLVQTIRTVPLAERLDLDSIIVQQAPQQPVVTNNATISFSYCVVSIERSWFYEPFIRNPFWRVPGQAKGQLSANDGHGLSVLPVGFVAIKDLSIKAPWTPEDISNLEQSVQFGPFNFDSRIVDGAIGHAGIQIVGWMLEDLPDLPPNS